MFKNELPISESFYSLQCEGVTNGHPAYFVRLKGCNLLCGNVNLRNVKDKTNQDEIDANGGSNATWVCDSIAVWLQGKQTPYISLIEKWEKEGELEYIKSGQTHVIWTGGEPTLHADNIYNFMDFFKQMFPHSKPFYEIETNGTREIPEQLFYHLNQINCSPKLSNSGMPLERRVNERALKQINQHPHSWFKYVVSSEEDLREAERDMIEPFNLDKRKVILMPGLSEQKDYFERTKFCYELAKNNHYIGISRGHIAAWDKVTGV